MPLGGVGLMEEEGAGGVGSLGFGWRKKGGGGGLDWGYVVLGRPELDCVAGIHSVCSREGLT